MLTKEIYTKTKIFEDGSISISDVTEDIFQLKRQLKQPPKETEETLSVDDVANILKLNPRTIRNKMSNGEFVEGKHYIRLSSRNVVFLKKPLMKMLKIS